MATKEDIISKLKTIINPTTKQTLVESGLISSLELNSNKVHIKLQLPKQLADQKEAFKALIEHTLKEIPTITVQVEININSDKNVISSEKKDNLKQIKHILAVSSCKGGVGKSTVSVNLAFSLAQQGFEVGLFDADLYGPSLPTMVATNDDLVVDGEDIYPIKYKDIKLMSFGFTENANQSGPAILRGPMVSQIIHQLLTQTLWGELDYLVIDLPPGTGDIQITLCQILPITAAVIVTTPQHISFIDVVKGIEMFDTLKVPVVGAVENMSYFETESGSKQYPFGKGALERLKSEFGFKTTLEIPLEESISNCGDTGTPFMEKHTESDIAKRFKIFANEVDNSIKNITQNGLNIPKVSFDEGKGILIIPEMKPAFYINAKRLRLACNSAYNKNEFTGEALVDEKDIPENIHPLSMNPVGNYALGINWSDGHSSLYPYEQLYDLA